MVTPKKIIMKDLELADEEIARLMEENKMLKKYKDKDVLDIIRWSEKLREENEELKRKNKNLFYEIKCWYENRKERDKRMLELEKENKQLKEDNERLKGLVNYLGCKW